MSRMIPEQVTERPNRGSQNIGIVFLKSPGEIVFEQADIKGFPDVLSGMIHIKSGNGSICIGILESLSRILVGITDRTGCLDRGTDATAKSNVIIVLQSVADALQNVCETFYIVPCIRRIRKTEDQGKMPQIQ